MKLKGKKNELVASLNICNTR